MGQDDIGLALDTSAGAAARCLVRRVADLIAEQRERPLSRPKPTLGPSTLWNILTHDRF